MRSKINDLINNSKSILLLTHESPDGDAIGSVLAFYYYLISINKSVDMVILDVPKVFDFLPCIDRIVDNVDGFYDLGIVLDCASKERIGQKGDILSKCKNTIVIDHHISNTKYGDVNYVMGDISSCSQVVYYLFRDLDISISKEMGEAIITGVLTDTNGFGHCGVDGDTFKLACELNDIEVDIHSIYQKVLWTKTMSQYNLMKIGMDRLEFLCDRKIAFTYILEDDFINVGAILGEHEGIVDIGRNIDGVLVSIFIRENNGWSISLRSTGMIDVGKIALNLGGGGHRMASGGKLYGSFDEVKDKVINEVERAILEK